MAIPKFSEDVRPLADLKTKTSAIIEQVRRSRRPVLLTRRGRGLAVIIDLEEYERLVERAAFVSAVEDARKMASEGKLRENDEAMTILDTFGRSRG